jgi:hypothetical protein
MVAQLMHIPNIILYDNVCGSLGDFFQAFLKVSVVKFDTVAKCKS